MTTRNNKPHQRIMQSKWRQQGLLFALLFVFGFILMSHIQSVDANVTQVDLIDQYQARQDELKQYEQQNAKLMQENNRLTKAKEQSIVNLLNDAGNEQLLQEINRVKLIAGLSEIQGRGITLTLNDKPNFDMLKDPLESIVHDLDVRNAVDLLRSNGAIALSINGYRLVNSTYILCVGPTILVNQERLVPPYVISAVGDAGQMMQAIADDQYLAFRKQFPTGIQITAQIADTVILPPFNETDQLQTFINLLEVSG
jgi:uncharacterized protein YlxW (UPF0749 family)